MLLDAIVAYCIWVTNCFLIGFTPYYIGGNVCLVSYIELIKNSWLRSSQPPGVTLYYFANVHSVKLPSKFLSLYQQISAASDLIEEVSCWSGQKLMHRLKTSQSAENKCGSAQP